MLKARISGQLRSRGHLHPAGVCQRPKLLELFKQLGGEFKFVTGKPYQTVFSTNMIGFAEAAYQCENYYNEQKKNATSVEVKKAFRAGKVKEIIQEGENNSSRSRLFSFVSRT
jgi:hypothetical protein